MLVVWLSVKQQRHGPLFWRHLIGRNDLEVPPNVSIFEFLADPAVLRRAGPRSIDRPVPIRDPKSAVEVVQSDR